MLYVYRVKPLIVLLSIILFLSPAYGQNERARQIVSPAAEVTITVNEQFFTAFLDAMFTNLKPPSTALAITPGDKGRTPAESYGCPSAITLQREEAGVKTAIKLEQGKIAAPLAFAGSYNSTLLGCIEFRGWADSSWTLEFDRGRHALLARIEINEVHLTNVPSVAAASLAKIVQSEIDRRINPLELLRLDQLSMRVPIAPSNGALRLKAKEVRPEIVPGALNLHIVYEFLPDR
jgi:hypothetical protein